jgi:hypothetical protein
MMGVRMTAMSGGAGDVVNLFRGAVKGVTHGVVLWTTVALTVAVNLVLLSR